jgi:hypothetical protein
MPAGPPQSECSTYIEKEHTMFSNGIFVQTHTGNTFIDAELAYHQERMFEAARDARQARQARATRIHGPRRLDRLRGALHRAPSRAAAVR